MNKLIVPKHVWDGKKKEKQKQEAPPTPQKPPTVIPVFKWLSDAFGWAMFLGILIFSVAGLAYIIKVRGWDWGGTYGSWNTPTSSRQFWKLKNLGYDGPMPQSSRDAHYRIKDLLRGGSGHSDDD